MSSPLDRDENPSSSASSSSTSPPPTSSATPISALFPPIIANNNSSTHLVDDNESNPVIRPYTTQRCFTFCSQSSLRRDTGWDPVCRAVCWKVDRSDDASKQRTPGYLDRQRAERAGVASSSSSAISSGEPSTLASTSIMAEFAQSVSHWIGQRSITAFKGTLDEMVEMQKEGQRYDPAWDQEGSLKARYFDSIGRTPSYYYDQDSGRGKAQRRWEEMSDLEYDLREGYAREYAAEVAAAQQAQLDQSTNTNSNPNADLDHYYETAPAPVRPTTLAERQFMRLVKEEQAHLERHQRQRQQARSPSERDRDVTKFDYHSEPLPSGGTHITLPLSTVVIAPWYALARRTEFIFSPVYRLGKMYTDSFRSTETGHFTLDRLLTSDTAQGRGLSKMYDQVVSGKVWTFGGKVAEKCGDVWGGWLGLGQGEGEGRGKEDGGTGSSSSGGGAGGGRKAD
ncbi:hypothetical protein HD553DRAFT_362279 [Filobasidium floriforme]|uniref:uncharacterized protein n=1 Tax=Filobasidium floriforme TaxID=5210 RepID=UPI001E8DE083|nr:uncharacterized protein HD553DRAFT_362279 [Filobasidium floriforme]KAH8080200.1 hypothetical protein HD553DRAFT_362279 [Filobasidium floriforme]